MLAQALRAAAESLHVPGQEDWRVIGPASIESLAAEHRLPRWQVEIAALEAEIVPLRYMRNLARFGIPGQITLLGSAVTVVGAGLPIHKCLQTLAAHGIGRLRVLTPDSLPAARSPEALAAVVINQNASLQTSTGTINLRRGDPVAALGEPDVVVACVEDAADEMLLQAASKRRRVPLVLGGLQGDRGQATTIFPGDPGVGLIYREDHPHLDRTRPGSLRREGYQGMIVGAWLADQVIAFRLGLGELLENRLLYADMRSGEMQTYPLGGSRDR